MKDGYLVLHSMWKTSMSVSLTDLPYNSSISIAQGEDNWILAAVPTPNATLGWKVKGVMLRYRILGKTEFGNSG